MTKTYFPTIGKIPFEGPESKNPLAFHYYEPDRLVMGKKMKDWLVAYPGPGFRRPVRRPDPSLCLG